MQQKKEKINGSRNSLLSPNNADGSAEFDLIDEGGGKENKEYKNIAMKPLKDGNVSSKLIL